MLSQGDDVTLGYVLQWGWLGGGVATASILNILVRPAEVSPPASELGVGTKVIGLKPSKLKKLYRNVWNLDGCFKTRDGKQNWHQIWYWEGLEAI